MIKSLKRKGNYVVYILLLYLLRHVKLENIQNNSSQFFFRRHDMINVMSTKKKKKLARNNFEKLKQMKVVKTVLTD